MDMIDSRLAEAMKDRLGYQPSRDQLITISMLAEGKSDKDIAMAIGFRDPLVTHSWIFSVCLDLGFGETETDCKRQGLARLREKAVALAGMPGGVGG